MEETAANLRHITGAVYVARLGTLSEAARSINLSQPALTQGLARLERSVGVALFARTNNGMVETEAGRIYVTRARRGLDYLQRWGQILGQPNIWRLLTLGQLRCVIAAVEGGGFRSAAAAMGRNVSTVSRACHDIEALAGTPLFEKTSHGLHATRQAVVLARLAGLALNEFRQAAFDARGWQGSYEGRLDIGSLPLLQAAILPAALKRFAGDFPGVAPRVAEGSYGALSRALLRGELDLLVGALRRDDLPEGLAQVALFTDRLCVVAGPGHPLARARTVEPAMLAGFPWVAPRRGAPSRRHFDALHDRLQVPPGVPMPIETGSHTMMKGLLLDSERLTVVSAMQVADELARGALARIALPLPDSDRAIGYTYRSDWLPSVPQQRFVDILREVVAQALPAAA